MLLLWHIRSPTEAVEVGSTQRSFAYAYKIVFVSHNLGASYTYFHKYLPKTEIFRIFVSCLRGSHDILTKNNFLHIYKTHLRNVPKTHSFDDYFIFKCLL